MKTCLRDEADLSVTVYKRSCITVIFVGNFSNHVDAPTRYYIGKTRAQELNNTRNKTLDLNFKFSTVA